MSSGHFRPDVPVSPGALVSLFGAGFSEETQSATAIPLPFSLAEREVEINDELKAPFLFLSANQANLQLPSSSPLGQARIAVRAALTGELLAGGILRIAAASPAFFSISQDGSGQGVVLNQDGRPNSPSNPAPRGSVVQLFGTGQGKVCPEVADGEPAPSSPLASKVAAPTADGSTCLNEQPSVCVAIGSTFGDVHFSGLTPGFVGLWQVNVGIPEDVLAGPGIPVRAVINGRPSNIITVALAQMMVFTRSLFGSVRWRSKLRLSFPIKNCTR